MIPGIVASAAAGVPANDPYWANVSALLHADGADGSTTFTDQTGKTWTATGTTQIDTAESRFGGASCLNGSNAYVGTAAHADFGFGTGPYTLELWVRRSSGDSGATGDYPLLEFRTSTGQRALFYLAPTTRALSFFDTTNTYTAGTAPALNTWAHVAFTNDGTSLRAFLNGVTQWTQTNSANFGATRPVRIGANFNASAALIGHWDECRITKGVARYTADFAPPSSAFPNS